MWVNNVEHTQNSIIVKRLRKMTPRVDAHDCQHYVVQKPFDLILKQLGL